MGVYDKEIDRSAGTDTTASPAPHSRIEHTTKTSGFDTVKNKIADKLKNVAGTLHEKTVGQNAQSGMAQYGRDASEWLDQTAEYIRDFDYDKADANVREYVKENPGRSLLIAGGIGLLIGAVLRRR